MAALVALALVGGAALVFGDGSAGPADDPETDGELLLDFPISDVPPFRAVVRYAFAPDALAAVGLLYEDVVVDLSYGGPGRYRVDLRADVPFFPVTGVTTSAPASASGTPETTASWTTTPGSDLDPQHDGPPAAAGSFVIVRDGEVGEYMALDRVFRLEDRSVYFDIQGQGEPLLPFLWETWDDLCTFGEHEMLFADPTAGRETVRLRCVRGDLEYEISVDAGTGLVLRVSGPELPSAFVPFHGPTVGYEVLSVDYAPAFADGFFDLVAPSGADVDDVRVSGPPPVVAPGDPAPDLRGTTLAGAPFDLDAHREARVALLFWGASWCPPCLDALDDVATIAGSRDEVAFVTVLVDDVLDDARAVLAERGIEIPTVEPVSYEEWGVLGVPLLVLVDEDGTVAATYFGAGPFGSVEGLLRDAGW